MGESQQNSFQHLQVKAILAFNRIEKALSTISWLIYQHLIEVPFSGWAMVRKNYPKDIERFAIDDHVLYRANLDLLFAPSKSALAKTFEQGLHKIKSSGEYDEILATYLPKGSGQ